jgi:uncharacterized protein (DUF983 family)
MAGITPAMTLLKMHAISHVVMAGLVPAIHVFLPLAASTKSAYVLVMSDTPSPIIAGLTCRCPRCGQGKLLTGFLAVRPRCEHCGLDYAFADAGDGPAVFIILGAGFLVVFAALIMEVLYQPPFWLHAVLWLPLILATTILPLRPLKGLMIALQFHHKAAEGKLEKRGERKGEQT